MPVFTQLSAKEAGKKAIPQEMIEEHKKFIAELEEGKVGQLEFGEGEDVALSKKALQEAGTQLGIFLKVSKARGNDRILRFKKITEEEHKEAQKIAEARAAKMRGKPKARKKK
jgi:hypothetical protein